MASTGDNETAARIDELEARVAQQDHALLALSDEMYSQQKRIAALEAEVRELVERLQALLAQPVADSRAEIPPHY